MGRVFQPSAIRVGAGPTVTVGYGLETFVGVRAAEGAALIIVVDPVVVLEA